MMNPTSSDTNIAERMATAGIIALPRWAARRLLVETACRGAATAVAAQLAADEVDRIPVRVGVALLQRDDRVVGDVDVLGTHLRAALGDVAEPETALGARLLHSVEHVLGMHLQAG